MIDAMVEQFNKDEVFLALFDWEYALEFCVLVALRYSKDPDSAISRPDLVAEAARLWEMRMKHIPFPGGKDPDRVIRATVRDLRRRGALILSTSSGQGYWRAGDLEVVKEFTKNEFRDRALDMLVTARRMRQAAFEIFGRQMGIFDLVTGDVILYNEKEGI